MSDLQPVARLSLLIVIAVGVLAGCISGEDDDPTQTPVVIVITSTPEATPTDEPTATTPATSTSTPEPSLTPEPSPALSEVLLQTDFSSWPSQEFEFGSLAYGDDDLYHVTVTEGGGTYVSAYSIDHEPFTDAAISVDVRMVAGDPSTAGCVLARVDQISHLYDYALCVDGNGNIEALYEQFDAEGNYSSEVLLPAGQVAVPPPTEWLTLTIISRGEEFWFLANNELLGTAAHSGPTGGSAGVIVNHFIDPPQTPAEFVFTNLVVQALQ